MTDKQFDEVLSDIWQRVARLRYYIHTSDYTVEQANEFTDEICTIVENARHQNLMDREVRDGDYNLSKMAPPFATEAASQVAARRDDLLRQLRYSVGAASDAGDELARSCCASTPEGMIECLTVAFQKRVEKKPNT